MLYDQPLNAQSPSYTLLWWKKWKNLLEHFIIGCDREFCKIAATYECKQSLGRNSFWVHMFGYMVSNLPCLLIQFRRSLYLDRKTEMELRNWALVGPHLSKIVGAAWLFVACGRNNVSRQLRFDSSSESFYDYPALHVKVWKLKEIF